MLDSMLKDILRLPADLLTVYREIQKALQNPALADFAKRVSTYEPVTLLVTDAHYFDLTRNCIRSFQAAANGKGKLVCITSDAAALPLFEAEGVEGILLTGVIHSASRFSDIGTKDFYAKVYFKLFALLALLEKGYPVLYADGDVFWKRDPLLKLPSGFDFVFQLDERTLDSWNSRPVGHSVCTGFFLTQPSCKARWFMFLTLAFMKLRPTWGDQDVVNYLINILLRLRLVTTSNSLQKLFCIRLGYFDPHHYPNGALFFNPQHRSLLDMEKIEIVHANYTVGHSEKVQKLKENGLWLVPSSDC